MHSPQPPPPPSPGAAAGAAGRVVRRGAAAPAAASAAAAHPPSSSDGDRVHHAVVPRPASRASWLGLATVLALTALAAAVVAAVKAAPPAPVAAHRSLGATLASPDALRVLAYGWITAASTGLGALPFARSGGSAALAPSTVAACNAFSGGMMLSASGMLLWEGATHEAHAPEQQAAAAAAAAAASGAPPSLLAAAEAALAATSPLARALGGVALGVALIVASKAWLDAHEHVKLGGFEGGADARRAVLILGVMTLHSLSEGIGLGVSFGSAHDHFGALISATLAVHNVPEGLAVALVLSGKGVAVVDCALWAVLTSLPQPVMALPAYVYVQHFLPVLPVGLGLAAGAMSYVALFELLAEARQELPPARLAGVALPAGLLMVAAHAAFK
jgi:zinc transporter, ZIP family